MEVKKGYDLKGNTYNVCRELLISKVYPHLKADPKEVGNKIHNNKFYKTIFPEQSAEQLEKEFKLQDKYFEQGKIGNLLKTELTIFNLVFAKELEKHESETEQIMAHIESEDLLHRINLECIAGAGLLAQGKTKKEALEIFRKHLGDLGDKYKAAINAEFKKLRL